MSAESNYLAFMNNYLVARTQYLATQDSKPIQIPLLPRSLVISAFEQSYAHSITSRKGSWPASTTTGFEKSFSSTPLEELSTILLKDLFLHKLHKGSFILGRIISKIDRIAFPHFLIEDVEGSVVMVTLSYDSRVGNYQTSQAQLDALYPLGSTIAIREPYFVLKGQSATIDENSTGYIKIESPSDLIFLPSTSPLIQNIIWTTEAEMTYSPMEYRALGAEFYKTKDYIVAQFLFTQAIDATPIDSTNRILDLYRNRSMAALLAGNFAISTRDCKRILEMLESGTPVPKNDPALQENTIKRLANAQYGQRKFSAALERFEMLAKEYPSNESGRLGVARCRKRLEESTSGNYDWEAIESEVAKAETPSLIEFDVGDFFHPSIEIELIDGRGGGRGIIAKKDIKAGELLVVEKAFAVGKPGITQAATYAVHLECHRMCTNTELDVVRALCDRLRDDPSNLEIIKRLYAGDDFDTPAEAQIPRLSDQEAEKVSDDNGRVETVDIDISRLESLRTVNAMGLGLGVEAGPDFLDQIASPSAIFSTASFINHSCISNASWRTQGDLVIVRSASKIKKGEEITIQYTTGTKDYPTRCATLLRTYSIKCNCPLCVVERNEMDSNAQMKKRKELIQEFEKYRGKNSETRGVASISAAKRDIDTLYRIIGSLNCTYSSSNENLYKPELFFPNAYLAALLSSLAPIDRSYLPKSIQAAFSAFESIGFVVEKKKKLPMMITSGTFSIYLENSIELAILITSSYKELNDTASMKVWLSTAQELERIRSGEREIGYFKKTNSRLFVKYRIGSLA